MALFIEVNDIDKRCPVIINLDTVMEIAPIVNPNGCEITFLEQDDPDAIRREKLGGGAVKGRRVMRVANDYNEFKQFVIQPVSAEDIARVNNRNKDVVKEKIKPSFDIPKL